ncbi:MAG TPA: hypothetical protein VJU16_07645 [Planctomycetota bacterium]|nr:hypothetical protein [Planctomycetota bacterium]
MRLLLGLLALLATSDFQDETYAARLERERKHDESQRARRLGLVTLQLKSATRKEAIKAICSQSDVAVITSEKESFDDYLRVNLDVKDMPLRQCMDLIEDQLKLRLEHHSQSSYEAKATPPTRKPRTHLPGVTLEVVASRFRPDDASGWSLSVKRLSHHFSQVDAVELWDSKNVVHPLERCGRCSPHYFLLKTASPGPFKVKVKGRLRWESHYEFKLADPTKGQIFKVGDFNIEYVYPKLTWKLDKPVQGHMSGRAEIDGVLKKEFRSGGVYDTLGVGGVSYRGRADKSWCRCKEGPAPVVASDPKLISGGRYSDEGFRLEQYESLKVLFFKPIEEPFEAVMDVATE